VDRLINDCMQRIGCGHCGTALHRWPRADLEGLSASLQLQRIFDQYPVKSNGCSIQVEQHAKPNLIVQNI
jgi:hypothetical protein